MAKQKKTTTKRKRSSTTTSLSKARKKKALQRFAAVFGSKLRDEDAEIIGERLIEIEQANGEITPRLIVEDARPSGSVLHKYFEWNDTKAAEQHRLSQARQLVRSVRIVFQLPNEKKPRETRAFVSVINREERRTYMESVKVLQDAELRQQIFDRLDAEFESLVRKYDGLLDTLELYDAIAAKLQRMKKATG